MRIVIPYGTSLQGFERELPVNRASFDELFDEPIEEVEARFDPEDLGCVLGDFRLRQREYVPLDD